MTFIIETYEDLVSIKRGVIKQYDNIQLSSNLRQKLKEKDALQWEEKLGRDVFECGCSAGAFTMISSVFLYLALIFFILDDVKLGWPVFLIGFGIAFFAGGVVKLIAIFKAKIRLKKTIQILGSLCFKDQFI